MPEENKNTEFVEPDSETARIAREADNDIPGTVQNQQEKVYLDLAQSTKVKSKVELSPQYGEILRGYLRLRDDPHFKLATFHRLVLKLDPEINISSLFRWVEKMKRLREKERQNKIKILADDALSNEGTIEGIRNAAIKVFYLKVTEFLRNPDMLDHMSFKDALALYEKIEKLSLATREMELKSRGENRKDAFAIFTMRLLAGSSGLKDVEDLQSATYGQDPSRTLPPAG